MKKSTHELKEDRGTLLKKADQLLAKCEAEGRSMTKTESDEVARLRHECEGRRLEIEKLEAVENQKRDQWIAESGFGVASDAGFGARDGRPIALRSTDKLTSYARPLPDGIRPDEISIGRAIRAIATGDWKHAQAEQRVMATSPGADGGFLVPEYLSANVIDLARNMAVCFKAGALTVPMESSVLDIARVAGDVGTAWKPENDIATGTYMPLEQVKLTARTLYCGPIAMSMEVAQDAPNIDATLQHSMTQAVALGLDYAALAGDGSGATPIGVLYADRVKDMSPIWTPFDNHDDFSWAVEYLMGANCNIDNASVVMPPAVYAGLDRLKDTLHQPLQPPASYAGLKKFVSNQISMDTGIGDASSPTTACIVGDFTQMLIGMRLELQIQSTYQAYDAFARAQIWVRAILRADVALAHPEHFARMTGLTGYSDDMPSI